MSKQEALELKLLYEIKLNLSDSKDQITLLIQNQQSSVNSYRALLNHLEDQQPYHDSLAFYFVNLAYFFSPQLTSSSYETLKQKGVEIIKNDSLKRSVVRMYEVIFKYISEDIDKSEWLYSESIVQPFFASNFQISDTNINEPPKAIPNDYDKLKQNQYFRNILAQLLTIRKAGAMNSEFFKQEVEILITNIDKELNKRGFKKID
jgi:hypothetical protein